MTYTALNAEHIKNLQTMVAPERFSTGESNLDLHARDMSSHPPSCPEAVLWPVAKEEVVAVMKYAHAHAIPVTAWGAGSSLEGNPIPVQGGIVLDFSQMNRILKIHDEAFQVDVQPGVVYKEMNHKLRHRGLFFPPDPGAAATIGGMIANNASGTRTVRYGATKDHVLRLSVVLANGEMIEMGTRASKTSSGYDLVHLFVGSEGTLGIVVEATLRLVGYPEEQSAAIVTFPSVAAAGKAVFEIMRAGLQPAALELLSPECVVLLNRTKELGLPEGPTLFTEFHGPSQTQLAEVMALVETICSEGGALAFKSGLGREETGRIFSARHQLGEIIRSTHGKYDIKSLDMAVPINAYPEMIAYARVATSDSGLPTYIFSHAGDGNLHIVIATKNKDAKQKKRLEEIAIATVTKALELGGTATGEHGVGIGKRRFMQAEHGNSFAWMKNIKTLFDPKGILNPGKIFE